MRELHETCNTMDEWAIIGAGIELMLAMEDEAMISENQDLYNMEIQQVATPSLKKRGSKPGRLWWIPRNDLCWMSRFALTDTFIDTSGWRALFRVKYKLFHQICNRLRSELKRTDTILRNAIPVEVRIVAFLLWCGNERCQHIGSRLGIGASSITPIVREVSRLICEHYDNEIQLPNTTNELNTVIKGFERVSGLPLCVGAIDGSHIQWPTCPKSKKFEYRCYKGYSSVVLFGVCDSSRKFTYADVGLPGVLSDSSIYERSRLRTLINRKQWPPAHCPSLQIGNVSVKPYLIGDCAFSLEEHMMKTMTVVQQRNRQEFRLWEHHASQARKPIECSFGILKNRFMRLKDGIYFHHEDDMAYAITSCIILHNISIDIGDDGEDLATDECNPSTEYDFTSKSSHAGERVRDALIHYLRINSDASYARTQQTSH